MPTKPEFRIGSHLAPGIAAIALFFVLAFVFITSSFPTAQGFPADANITANIGYALFNIDAGEIPAEGFIVAFFAIAIVLDAALDGSVMLARREEQESASLTPDRGGFEGGEE
ncbi:MAG: proton-conducting membrane transporter [Euryarchaeota archaeon]|jgi:NADH-quinone oxidoreductase subunit J|nr:proton-conducting membrane transporter [Euryarchaeota archaeon]